MNSTILILVVVGIALYLVIFAAIWASRYVKVAPNQVLIVSGRQRQLPDGTRVGFRVVKGGGTFVFPVVEKVNALSLEILIIEIPKFEMRTGKGGTMTVDCVAQVKIKSDDASILLAVEHFLSKAEWEIKNSVRLVLEKHLGNVLGSLTIEEIGRDLGACEARVEAEASADVGKMGLGFVSLSIRNVHLG